MEQVIVSLFTEVKRHKPSVIYVPNIESWFETIGDTIAFTTFKAMLKSIPPTDPILVLATAEHEHGESVHSALLRDVFGFSRKNRLEIDRPKRVSNSYLVMEKTMLIIIGKPVRILQVDRGSHSKEPGRLSRSRQPSETSA